MYSKLEKVYYFVEVPVSVLSYLRVMWGNIPFIFVWRVGQPFDNLDPLSIMLMAEGAVPDTDVIVRLR